MSTVSIISDAIRRFSRTVSGVIALGICALSAVVSVSGCSKEGDVREPKEFGGPASVTLILSSGSGESAGAGTRVQSGADLNVDEENIIHCIKIFAFKHDPGFSQNDEMVGYASFDGLGGSGRHYLPMSLTASGDIDFYVIANDIYTESTTVLGENSGRSDIEGLRFTGLRQADGVCAIPMTNIIGDRTAIDSNNFTFKIEESSSDAPQLIPIDVTRAMARLSFYFAKTEQSTEVSVNSISIAGQGPGSAGCFTADGAPDGYYSQDSSIGLFDTKTTIEEVNPDGYLDEEYLQYLSDADSYLLPNTYGSDDPDELPPGTGYQTFMHVYTVYVNYSVNGSEKTKTIYLPAVSPNDWIKVKGIFNTSVDDVELDVVALYWEQSNMDIEFN